MQDIAPFTAYMYEMMIAKECLRNRTKPVRFLLVGDDYHVSSLVDVVGPAFEAEELVKWVNHTGPLTFGKNTRDGLVASATNLFLLVRAEIFIHVVHSTFGGVVARAMTRQVIELGE